MTNNAEAAEIDAPTAAVVNALYPNETLEEIPPIPGDIRVRTARRAISAYLAAACPIPPAAPVVQEGIRCSHGVQGPYASAGEPIANCGERGTVVYRLLHPNGEASEWSVTPPAEGGNVD